jgi:hypothetical protein
MEKTRAAARKTRQKRYDKKRRFTTGQLRLT